MLKIPGKPDANLQENPEKSHKINVDLAASSCRNISIRYLKEAMGKIWKNLSNYNQFTVAYVSHSFFFRYQNKILKAHEILRNQWYDAPLLTWEKVVGNCRRTTRLGSQTLVPLPAPPTFVLRQIHPPAINTQAIPLDTEDHQISQSHHF